MRPNSMLLPLLSAAWLCQAQEDRAVAYLTAEVRQWPEENHCFSCHNNGDGARALFLALQTGRRVAEEALRETNGWLKRPGEWQGAANNPGGVSDKVLAAIQFGAALVDSPQPDRKTLLEAAESLVPHQKPDGSWRIDTGSVGSPVTYGTSMATYMARRTLATADKTRFAEPIARADAWFARQQPVNVPDAVASMLAGVSDQTAFLLKAQNSDGGWGPWSGAPSEPFDTALALLALNRSDTARDSVRRGRAYLIQVQEPSGGWPATTRPPGGQSYAQRISTTAWATIALLQTNLERK